MITIQFSWEELINYTGGSWYKPAFDPPHVFGISSISTDTRKLPKQSMFLALIGDTFDGHDFISQAIDAGVSAICIEKKTDAIKKIMNETDIHCLVVNNTLTAYQNLANAHRSRFKKIIVIAVTGSNGKTTTKEIIGHIIKHCSKGSVLTSFRNTNNQIGVPQNLLKLNKDHQYLVIELGTNSPGEIEILTKVVMPDIGIITNVGPVHLEKLDDIDGVTKEKASLLTSSNKTRFAIIPHSLENNQWITPLNKRQSFITFGTEKEAKIRLNYKCETLVNSEFEILNSDSSKPIRISWCLSGAHLAINSCIGFAIGQLLNFDEQRVAEALTSFSMPGMRMDVKFIDDICIINDAYNANPDSMLAFITWLKSLNKSGQLKGTVYLILGDMLELGNNEAILHFQILEKVAIELVGVKTLLVGSRMQGASKSFDFLTFASTQSVKHYLLSNLKQSDTIALKGSRGMKLETIIDDLNLNFSKKSAI